MYQEKEVRAGMSLLDEKNPGWEEKFNPVTLNLADPNHCVLGQVYGEYVTGLGALGIWLSNAYRYGFIIPPKELSLLAYSDLNETWRQLVNERHEHTEILSINQRMVPVLV